MKTNDLQYIINATIATDINVTINSLYLYVPILIPNTQTQVMFNESIQKIIQSLMILGKERNLSTDGNDLQVDIGSTQHVNGPKNLITTFQTEDRKGVPKKLKNIAIFDNVNVRKYFVEIDGYRCPKDAVLTNFTEND